MAASLSTGLPAPKFVESLYLLTEMGEGLLCSTYMTLSRMHSNKGYRVMSSFVEDPRFGPLRARIGKAFPKVPDLSRVDGYSEFYDDAPVVVKFFLRYKKDVHSIIDFERAASELLRSIPEQLSSSGLSLEQNRNLCILYIDLFCVYVRVLYLFATNHRAKVLYSLNHAAERVYKMSLDAAPDNDDNDFEDEDEDEDGDGNPQFNAGAGNFQTPKFTPSSAGTARGNQTKASAATGGTLRTAGSKQSGGAFSSAVSQSGGPLDIPYHALHTDSDIEYASQAALLFQGVFGGLHRFLLDTFAPASSFLTNLLRQIAPSVSFGLNIERIVADRVLNPCHLGAAIGQPDCPKLPNRPALSLYEEVMDLEKYCDFAVLVALSCPAVLFDDQCRAAFEGVASSRLVVRLFRDVSLVS